MTTKFDYIKYAALPWAYDPVYPYIPGVKTLNVSDNATKSLNVTMQPGDIYEFVMLSPGYIVGASTGSVNAATIFGKLNPTSYGTYPTRYSSTQLLDSVLSSSFSTKLLLSSSIQISSNANVSYKVCRYAKFYNNDADDLDVVSQINPTMTGTLIVGKSLYVTNTGTKTRLTSPHNMGSNKEDGPVVYYIGRITNNTAGVTSLSLVMKCVAVGPFPTLGPLVNDTKIPLSFAIHVLESIRFDTDIHMIGSEELEGVKSNLMVLIGNAIENLAQKWYDFTLATNIDRDNLINFIVYYMN